MSKLYAFQEDRLGFCYQLKGKTTLGRALDCCLVLSDRSASRYHAEIIKDNKEYFLSDLSSTNGTIVDGKIVLEKILLKPFSTIQVGRETFVFEPGVRLVSGTPNQFLIVDDLEKPKNAVEEPWEQAILNLPALKVNSLMKFIVNLPQTDKQGELLLYFKNELVREFNAKQICFLLSMEEQKNEWGILYSFPENKDMVLDGGIVDLVSNRKQVIYWPKSLNKVTFKNGERIVDYHAGSVYGAPISNLDAKGVGIVYLETENEFSEANLQYLATLTNVISRSFANSLKIEEISRHLSLFHDQTSIASDFFDTLNNEQHLQAVLTAAEQVALSNTSVLLNGEIGTGKTSLAKLIHQKSSYREGAFIIVNSSMLDENAQAASLFGQKTNSSSAFDSVVGYLEVAHKGTLFLQNVECLTAETQYLLLQFLTKNIFYPLGTEHPRTSDCRILSSSTIDLWEAVKIGKFREDLYLLLNQVSLNLPPLREIKSAIGNLAEKFISHATRKLGVSSAKIDSAAKECLNAYPWPGNIVELKYTVKFLDLSSRAGKIVVDDLPLHLKYAPEAFIVEEHSEAKLLEVAERRIIIRCLAGTSGDLNKTATMLKLKTEELVLKMRKFAIDLASFKREEVQSHSKKIVQTKSLNLF